MKRLGLDNPEKKRDNADIWTKPTGSSRWPFLPYPTRIHGKGENRNSMLVMKNTASLHSKRNACNTVLTQISFGTWANPNGNNWTHISFRVRFIDLVYKSSSGVSQRIKKCFQFTITEARGSVTIKQRSWQTLCAHCCINTNMKWRKRKGTDSFWNYTGYESWNPTHYENLFHQQTYLRM